jgi:hypothetical protein
MNKKVFEDELISGMQSELRKQASADRQPKLARAAECLHAALEILEQQGLQARADEVLQLLEKLARGTKVVKTAKIHSLQQLMEAGVSQRDIHEFARGNPRAVAKLNMTLRRLGMSDHEISKFLGPNHLMSEEQARKALNPNEPGSMLEFQSLSPKAPEPSGVEEALEFKSLAQKKSKLPKPDRHTKGLTPEKEVENLKHHGTPFNMADDACAVDVPPPVNRDNLRAEDMEPGFEDLLHAATFDIDASDDELMGMDIKEDTLEVFDADTQLEDFEDERD